MESPKLCRCIELAHLFQSGFQVKVQDLANKFGVSRRTIFRDIRSLEDAGIAMQYNRCKGTHRVHEGHHLRFSSLEEKELSLLVASICASAMMSHPLTRGRLQTTLAKLLNKCPRYLQDHLSNISNSCRLGSENREPTISSLEVFEDILQALGGRKQIRIQFSNISAKHKSIRTKVAPYYLEITFDKWYLVGRSTWHRRVLSFDLQDIESTEITAENYVMPCFHRATNSLKKNTSMTAASIPVLS